MIEISLWCEVLHLAIQDALLGSKINGSKQTKIRDIRIILECAKGPCQDETCHQQGMAASMWNYGRAWHPMEVLEDRE
jgi:hypothetical protein